MSKKETVTEYIEDGQVVSEIEGTWEAVTKDNFGNAHIHLLHKHSTKTRPAPPEITPELFVNQARPTTIRPTQRQRPTREGEMLIGLGDIHFPWEDGRALALAQLAIRELMPDTLVCLGDNQDQAMFSRFERRPEWVGSTQEGIDKEHVFWAQQVADLGTDRRLVRFQGNHDIRLEKEIRRLNAELIGLKRANAVEELGVLTLGFLLKLDELGVEQIDGYPNAELWLTDDFKIMHGRATSPTGKAAYINVNKEDVNTLSGHDHSMNISRRTIPTNGGSKEIFAFNAGTLATIDGTTTPSGRYSTTEAGKQVARAQNWQQGVACVFYDDESVRPYWLPIDKDGIDIFGRVYKS